LNNKGEENILTNLSKITEDNKIDNDDDEIPPLENIDENIPEIQEKVQ